MTARQTEDMRRDLAHRLLPSHGPFHVGQKVHYWWEEGKNMKKKGWWIPARVASLGSHTMLLLDAGTHVVRVKETKVRADPDPDLADPVDAEPTSSYVDCFSHCEHDKNVNVKELFAGEAGVTSACARTGLRVGRTCDLRTGHNLNTKSAQKKSLEGNA